MAKFCTKCGRRLIDGQPCSCTQTQQPVHDMQESVQKEDYAMKKNEQRNKYFEDICPVRGNILVKEKHDEGKKRRILAL